MFDPKPGVLERDELLYRQTYPAEMLFRIDEGYLLTHILTPSRDVGLSVYGPGDIIGTPTPADEYLESAQAITRVTYHKIYNDERAFHHWSLKNGNPLTTINLLLDRLERAQACNARQGGASHEAVRLLFEELLERFPSTPDGDFKTIEIPLTHQHIAMLVNCTRETISKTLADLRDEGILNNSRSPYGVNEDRLI